MKKQLPPNPNSEQKSIASATRSRTGKRSTIERNNHKNRMQPTELHARENEALLRSMSNNERREAARFALDNKISPKTIQERASRAAEILLQRDELQRQLNELNKKEAEEKRLEQSYKKEAEFLEIPKLKKDFNDSDARTRHEAILKIKERREALSKEQKALSDKKEDLLLKKKHLSKKPLSKEEKQSLNMVNGQLENIEHNLKRVNLLLKDLSDKTFDFALAWDETAINSMKKKFNSSNLNSLDWYKDVIQYFEAGYDKFGIMLYFINNILNEENIYTSDDKGETFFSSLVTAFYKKSLYNPNMQIASQGNTFNIYIDVLNEYFKLLNKKYKHQNNLDFLSCIRPITSVDKFSDFFSIKILMYFLCGENVTMDSKSEIIIFFNKFPNAFNECIDFLHNYYTNFNNNRNSQAPDPVDDDVKREDNGQNEDSKFPEITVFLTAPTNYQKLISLFLKNNSRAANEKIFFDSIMAKDIVLFNLCLKNCPKILRTRINNIPIIFFIVISGFYNIVKKHTEDLQYSRQEISLFLDWKDKDNKTIIDRAKEGNFSKLKNFLKFLSTSNNFESENPIYVINELCNLHLEADIKAKLLKIAELLIKSLDCDTYINEYIPARSNTMLLIPAADGNIELVNLLCENKSEAVTDKEDSIISIAILNGKMNVARMLLENKIRRDEDYKAMDFKDYPTAYLLIISGYDLTSANVRKLFIKSLSEGSEKNSNIEKLIKQCSTDSKIDSNTFHEILKIFENAKIPLNVNNLYLSISDLDKRKFLNEHNEKIYKKRSIKVYAERRKRVLQINLQKKKMLPTEEEKVVKDVLNEIIFKIGRAAKRRKRRKAKKFIMHQKTLRSRSNAPARIANATARPKTYRKYVPVNNQWVSASQKHKPFSCYAKGSKYIRDSLHTNWTKKVHDATLNGKNGKVVTSKGEFDLNGLNTVMDGFINLAGKGTKINQDTQKQFESSINLLLGLLGAKIRSNECLHILSIYWLNYNGSKNIDPHKFLKLLANLEKDIYCQLQKECPDDKYYDLFYNISRIRIFIANTFGNLWGYHDVDPSNVNEFRDYLECILERLESNYDPSDSKGLCKFLEGANLEEEKLIGQLSSEDSKINDEERVDILEKIKEVSFMKVALFKLQRYLQFLYSPEVPYANDTKKQNFMVRKFISDLIRQDNHRLAIDTLASFVSDIRPCTDSNIPYGSPNYRKMIERYNSRKVKEYAKVSTMVSAHVEEAHLEVNENRAMKYLYTGRSVSRFPLLLPKKTNSVIGEKYQTSKTGPQVISENGSHLGTNHQESNTFFRQSIQILMNAGDFDSIDDICKNKPKLFQLNIEFILGQALKNKKYNFLKFLLKRLNDNILIELGKPIPNDEVFDPLLKVLLQLSKEIPKSFVESLSHFSKGLNHILINELNKPNYNYKNISLLSLMIGKMHMLASVVKKVTPETNIELLLSESLSADSHEQDIGKYFTNNMERIFDNCKTFEESFSIPGEEKFIEKLFSSNDSKDDNSICEDFKTSYSIYYTKQTLGLFKENVMQHLSDRSYSLEDSKEIFNSYFESLLKGSKKDFIETITLISNDKNMSTLDHYISDKEKARFTASNIVNAESRNSTSMPRTQAPRTPLILTHS